MIKRMSETSSSGIRRALYVNAALLAAILAYLVGRGNGGSAAFAQPMQPIAGGAGLFMMPAQFSQTRWGCYLMDVDSQTLLAYEYDQGNRMLNLVAARGFGQDRRLRNLNTNPSPDEIRSLLDKEADKTRLNP